MYVVFAVIATGVANCTSCQPLAVSPLKVAEASNVPRTPQLPRVRARVARALVEPDALDVPGDVALEPHADFDAGRVVVRRYRRRRCTAPDSARTRGYRERQCIREAIVRIDNGHLRGPRRGDVGGRD